jgi:Asp-tRNA(Asn)/Glu-tRNA(Gln) amidotransferase A subunit family amidase
MTDTVRACLDRIAVLESSVRAFAWLDEERALRLAAESADGPLRGAPIGVKDLIDTGGIPTECGTALLAGRVPDRSAAVVRALEDAGAIVLGKTVTTELAFAAPGPTRNPWNLDRTPGGSSMGSAAGVAAGFFPLAIGTQTNSSTVMPAALCGVVGFKPSKGRHSLEGVLVFSPTLDQLGCFARSAEDCGLLASAMAGESRELWLGEAPRDPPRLAIARTSDWEGAAQAVRDRFAADVALLREAGAPVREVSLPAGLDEARLVHRTIMAFEGAAELGPLVEREPATVSAVLRRFLAEGAGVGHDTYQAARAERDRLVEEFRHWADGFDGVVTPAAPDEAPSSESTGDPRFCTRWTLVGAPAIVVRSGLGPQGLPIGLQLVGAPGQDARLLGTARWVESQLDPPPPLWDRAER